MKCKSLLACLMALILALGATGCAKQTAAPEETATGMTPGTYYSVGEGRGGAIVLKVTVGADKIEAIEVVTEDETHNTGSVPVELYPELIVANQSLDLDLVSGATISSAAMLTAVRDAITQAGGDPATFAGAVTSEVVHEDTAADIVVIGAGGAGMTAAARAAGAGKKVILLEKLDIVGGTSNYSIEGFGAVEDKAHMALGSDITGDALAATLLKGNPKGTPEAFEALAKGNGKAADWLRSIGAMMTVAGGQTAVATSREVGELGVSIISALGAECKKAGVDVRTGSKATELVMQDGAVAGVKVSTDAGDYTISTKAVILATGGFAANNEMVSAYNAALKGYGSSSSVGATGDGHLMAQAAGAELRDMDYIRVNFTYSTKENGYYYYMGSLFNTGAIFVNDEGQRFVNDQGAYGVGPKVLEQGGSGWAIFDNSIAQSVEDVRHYGDLGLYVSADSIEELAGKINVDATNLAATVEQYKGYVAAGKDEAFGRGMLNMTFDEAPYYACRMTCRVQGTFGGISTNAKAEVLTADGAALPGLYAAGECASEGTWGANPAAVNIVFGTIAAENAIAYLG